MAETTYENLQTPGSTLSPPHAVWTPGGRRASSNQQIGNLLPSSPILKDNDEVNGDVTPGSTGSSIRMSKNIDDLRWDGSSIRDNDSIFRQSLGYRNSSYRDTTPSKITGGMDNDTDKETDGIQSDNPDGGSEYSHLSKRADMILENAKRKLNLLQGNLGRARHSLLVPPSTGFPEFRSGSPGAEKSSHTDSDEDLTRASNSGNGLAPSREINSHSSSQRHSSGHSRVFSDTSVPSDIGVSIKGSRSLEHLQNRRALDKTLMELERESPALDTVVEDEATDPHDRRRRTEGLQKTKDLRAQADELRSRISFLQARSKDDKTKRQSLRLENGTGHSNNGSVDFSEQVAALKNHLNQQEKQIDELETAERRANLDKDPRAEWHQVLEQNDADDGDDDSYSDESSGYSSGDEYHIAEDLLLPEDEEDLQGPHEDRVDAFDYEHFILHSVMGNHIRRSSNSSTSTASTEKAGVDQYVEHYEDRDVDRVNRPALLPAESATSMTTADSFVTAADDREEDDYEDESSDDETVFENAEETASWPVPPGMTRRVSNVAAKASSRPATAKSAASDSKRRPASLIVSHLTRPQSSAGTPVTLKEEDKALMYQCAESFRTVCMNLQRNDLGPHDGVDLRQRLEIAKRVLNGDL